MEKTHNNISHTLTGVQTGQSSMTPLYLDSEDEHRDIR